VLWCLRLIDRVCCIQLECEAQPVSTVTQGRSDMNAQQVPQLHTSLFRCVRTRRDGVCCLTGAGSLILVTGQSGHSCLDINEPLLWLIIGYMGTLPQMMCSSVVPNNHSHHQTPLSGPALNPRHTCQHSRYPFVPNI
jgi:hypothetical protein